MGAVCCCFSEECEDYANPNSSVYRNCICLGCFLQNFLYLYTSLFRRGEEHMRLASPSYIHRPSSFNSSTSLGSIHSQEEGEPLRSDTDMDTDTNTNSLIVGKKRNGSTCEDGAKDSRTKLSLKLLTAKETTGFEHIYASSEDEDVCPTCLEEYTTEDPKIITKCSHHFHLGCIYEWMERSESCPVCGKVMAFNETI